MNKVLQAAGRVIRDASDQGIVLLADQRFTRLDYRQLFPRHWQSATTVRNLSELTKEITDFWHKSKSLEM